jgi:phosphoglycolate phosphatase-like HAD superfamily hydrolase
VSRFKAIAFDLDGVILESVAIKLEAMQVLFAGHEAHLAEIAALHERHAGISRYVKFDAIYRDILDTPLAPEARDELGRKFSNLVVEKVLACPFVPGAREFLEAHHRSTPLFVVSGTPDEELAAIVAGRGLTPYFMDVYGSGRGKAEILGTILEDLSCAARDLVFIGDGLTDFEAARAVCVSFVGRVREGEDSPFPASTALVSDLTGLDHALDRAGLVSVEPRP